VTGKYHKWLNFAEFMPNGNLYTLLASLPIDNEVKLPIIQGIARGMLHLSDESIVHRDLAARNILVWITPFHKMI
jgi:serine/threonine protein kinase